MILISEKQYKMKNYTKENLLALGFYYNKEKNNNENNNGEYYSYRFSVLKYDNHITMNAEITIDVKTGDVYFDVFDLKGNPYSPFYNCEYGNFDDVLAIINKNILKQLKKLGISKRKFGEKRKCKK